MRQIDDVILRDRDELSICSLGQRNQKHTIRGRNRDHDLDLLIYVSHEFKKLLFSLFHLIHAFTSLSPCPQPPMRDGWEPSTCAFGDQRPLRALFSHVPRSVSREFSRRALHILLPPSVANNFSTSAIMTSEPASSILPTRCQRMTPC